jgi:uncharacterized LabA/DUF88 family protein
MSCAETSPAHAVRTIAVLIDGDNAQAALIREMLAEIGRYGRAAVRRIYGDWTTPQMNAWKDVLQENAIQPVQQFRHTVGKNATDSAMIIDAMDILHRGDVDGFCLASSDSDYTRLATRIREDGVFVMGIGRNHTPKSFTNACDVFVFAENIGPVADVRDEGIESDVLPPQVASSPAKPISEAYPVIRRAVENATEESGWAYLSSVGSALQILDSSFDSRTFGCPNLRTLVAKFPDSLDVREAKNSGGNAVFFVRIK